MSESINHTIVLAGLLHDIGKYFQKLTHTSTPNHQTKGYELANKIIQQNRKLKINGNLISYLIKNHHHFREKENTKLSDREEDNLLKLLIISDWLDAEERISKEEDETTSKDNYIVSPLWILTPNTKKSLEEISKEYKINKFETVLSKYGLIMQQEKEGIYLFNIFEKKFKEIIEKNTHYLNIYNALDSLLFDHLFFIPSYNYVSKEKPAFPDISLYYHNKIVSILFYTLYLRYKYNEKFYRDIKKSTTQKELKRIKNQLLKEKIIKSLYIDVSGIQKFITNIKGKHKNNAKLLRGRSYYVEVMQKIVAQYICDKLNIPPTFILKDNGGFIHILIPSIIETDSRKALKKEEVNNFIKKIIEEINEKLFFLFKGELYLYHILEDIILEKQFKIDIKEYIIKRINSPLKDKKYFKMKNVSPHIKEQDAPHLSSQICEYCGVNKKYEGDKCKICNTLIELGGELSVKKEKITIKYDRDKLLLNPRDLFIKNENEETNSSNVLEYYNLNNYFNNKKIESRNKRIPISYEEVKYPFLISGLYVPLLTEKEVKSFEIIAKEVNNPFIAMIKIDIDDLGLIDLKMFKTIENLLPSEESIKHLKELYLSRKYAVYKYIELTTTLTLLKTIISNEKYRNNIYILYAGGDDIIIVAPLKIAFSFIKDYYKQADKSGCDVSCKYRIFSHKHITMSGAIRYEKYKYPFYLLYKLTNNLLEKRAKGKKIIKPLYLENNNISSEIDNEKNSIAYQYDNELYTLSWKEFEEISTIFQEEKNNLSLNELLFFNINNLQDDEEIINNSKAFKLNIVQLKYWNYLINIKYFNHITKINNRESINSIYYDYIANPHPYIYHMFRNLKENKKEIVEKISDLIIQLKYGVIYDYYSHVKKETKEVN